MKILFVEDENEKMKNILRLLNQDLYQNDIKVVTSIMSGMLALRKNNYDILVLDMSLPLYDINGEDEETNEFIPFGGLEILDEIERRELFIKVVVITAFDTIEDDTKKINLEQLDKQMKLKYSKFYLGCIHYDQSSLEWKTELKRYMEEM